MHFPQIVASNTGSNAEIFAHTGSIGGIRDNAHVPAVTDFTHRHTCDAANKKHTAAFFRDCHASFIQAVANQAVAEAHNTADTHEFRIGHGLAHGYAAYAIFNSRIFAFSIQHSHDSGYVRFTRAFYAAFGGQVLHCAVIHIAE